MSKPASAPARACTRCGGRNYLVDRRGEFAAAQLCECRKSCPECNGAGHVYVTREETFSARMGKRTYEVMAPCACQILRKRLSAFNAARIPGVAARATFESFRSQSEEQDRALKLAQHFAQTYKRNAGARGFVLSGPVGTGKTHLIAAALGFLTLEKGARTRYIELSLLYADIRRGFNEGKSGGEIIAPLSEVEVLAIDELGKGRGSQFELDTLDELIARRYNGGRTTLFATNYSLRPERPYSAAPRSGDEAMRKVRENDQLLRERTSDRIYSRLMEMCDFAEMPTSTRDYRRTRHELGDDERAPRPR